MKRTQVWVGVALVAGLALGVLGSRIVSAQDPTKMGTVLKRSELVGARGMEAILVLRELGPGVESGKHTQSGNEIGYVLEGSVVFEAAGKPPVTLKVGEAFSSVAGEVHNVKNASATAGAKSLVFYVAKTGTPLEGLSLPVK